MLSDALREGMFTTSKLWEHLRIEQGTTPVMFRSVGDAEVNINCREEDYKALLCLSMAKCAARKVMDWLVNDKNGLASILDLGGTHLANAHPFSLDDLERHFANGVGNKSTALMMNHLQYRALRAEFREKGEFLDAKLFGKELILNHCLTDAVWGLNLDNVHLWEANGGPYIKEGEVTKHGAPIVYWEVSLGHKYGDDVTVMKVA